MVRTVTNFTNLKFIHDRRLNPQIKQEVRNWNAKDVASFPTFRILLRATAKKQNKIKKSYYMDKQIQKRAEQTLILNIVTTFWVFYRSNLQTIYNFFFFLKF